MRRVATSFMLLRAASPASPFTGESMTHAVRITCSSIRASTSCRKRLWSRSEEHTSELQSRRDLVCRLLLEKKKKKTTKSLLEVRKIQRSQQKQKTANT